jgi:hypothetical protein
LLDSNKVKNHERGRKEGREGGREGGRDEAMEERKILSKVGIMWAYSKPILSTKETIHAHKFQSGGR